MNREILFVNRDPKVGENFILETGLKEKNIRMVFTADEAITQLEKSEFKIMITETNLPVMDGVQLIEYVNSKYPKTICIVYTSRMSKGQLTFMINHLRVWRIFLRPIENMTVVEEALQDGLAYYDRRASYRLVKEKVETNAHKTDLIREEIQRAIIQCEWMDIQLKKSIRRSLELFSVFEKEEVKGIRQIMSDSETLIISHIMKWDEKKYQDFGTLKQSLKVEFSRGKQRTIDVFAVVENKKLPIEVMYRIDLLSWLYSFRIAEAVREYHIEVKIESEEESEIKLDLCAYIEGDVDQYRNEYPNLDPFTDEIIAIMKQESHCLELEIEEKKIRLCSIINR